MISPVNVLRRLKHHGHRAIVKADRARTRAGFRRYSETHRPIYEAGLFPHHFINRSPSTFDAEWAGTSPPRRVFTLWTGSNPLTQNRQRSLQQLRAAIGVEVVLVTPDNLDEFLDPTLPLHPAYEYLSLVHRSDYLRCYLLHVHGGGYIDLKAPRHPWAAAFQAFEQQPMAMLMGYPEVDGLAVPDIGGDLGKALRQHYSHLPGMTAMIARPRTPLTALWMEELHRRLDLHLPELRAHPGEIWGEDPFYPLGWTTILGEILHPLAYRFHEHIVLDRRLQPALTNYR